MNDNTERINGIHKYWVPTFLFDKHIITGNFYAYVYIYIYLTLKSKTTNYFNHLCLHCIWRKVRVHTQRYDADNRQRDERRGNDFVFYA